MSDAEPVCTVEPGYWRDGPRWKVVLQVMYWTSATERGAGKGPFFPIAHTWTEAAAIAQVSDARERLKRSRSEVADWLTGRSEDADPA